MESALSRHVSRALSTRERGQRPASPTTLASSVVAFLSSYLLCAQAPDGIPGRLSHAIGLNCPRFLRQLSLLLPSRGPPRLTGTGAPGVLQEVGVSMSQLLCGSCWSSAPIRSQPASRPTPSLMPKRPESTVPGPKPPVARHPSSLNIRQHPSDTTFTPYLLVFYSTSSPQSILQTAILKSFSQAQTRSGTRTRR